MKNASSLPPHHHHHYHHPNNPLSCLGLEFWLLLIRGFLLGMPDQQLLARPTSSTTSASASAAASPASKRRRGGGTGSSGGPPTTSSPAPPPDTGSSSGGGGSGSGSSCTDEGAKAVACLRATCRWWRVAASVATAVAPEALLLGAQERRARWAAGGGAPATATVTAAAVPRARLQATYGAARCVLVRAVHAGKHACVSTAWLPGVGRVAVKESCGVSDGALAREAAGLRRAAQAAPRVLAPRLHEAAEDAVVMELVSDALPFVVFLEACAAGGLRELALWAAAELLEHARALDRLGVVKGEGTHPERHVLVQMPGAAGVGSPARVVLIDFDRAVVHVAPPPAATAAATPPHRGCFKNVTQTVQFLASARVSKLLGVEPKNLREGAQAYAADPCDVTMEAIVSRILG